MTERILIIEDEEKIARFIELELIHEGYEVEKCADGRTGLEKAESGGFSLVLLDIMLPGLNGLVVLRRLRKSSDVPVIMLTARDAVMDKVAGLDADTETNLAGFEFSDQAVIAVGGEDVGLPPFIRKQCDAVLRIPMMPEAHSYNASVALSLGLYEFARLRIKAH